MSDFDAIDFFRDDDELLADPYPYFESLRRAAP